jgi:hypothetical protein
MTPIRTDETLGHLIAGGQYTVAADRYEEETADGMTADLLRLAPKTEAGVTVFERSGVHGSTRLFTRSGRVLEVVANPAVGGYCLIVSSGFGGWIGLKYDGIHIAGRRFDGRNRRAAELQTALRMRWESVVVLDAAAERTLCDLLGVEAL